MMKKEQQKIQKQFLSFVDQLSRFQKIYLNTTEANKQRLLPTIQILKNDIAFYQSQYGCVIN